jgi:hypothetical protein
VKFSARKIIIGIIIGAACLVLLGITVFIVWRVRLANAVERQIAAIRAAGLPTNGAEANDYYTAVPNEENAALKMAESFALMTSYNDRRSNVVAAIKFPARKENLTAEQVELVAGYCTLNSNALATAKEAVKLQQCRYPLDLSQGAHVLLKHLAEMRKLARIAEFRTLFGQNDFAAEIITMTGMANTLDKEPILISKLVRIATLTMAVTAVEHRLNLQSLDDARLKLISEAFTKSVPTNQMANGFIGERAMFLSVFQMSPEEISKLADGGDEKSPEPSVSSFSGSQAILRLVGFYDRDKRFYLKAMETNIALTTMFPKNAAVITNIQEQIFKECARHHYILSSLLLPALGASVIKEAKGLAQIYTAQTALAVERFRLAHGKLPEKLDELVPQFLPAVPQDPFDGQPLRYRRLEKGYVIYSVDRDGMDNGGRERPASIKSSDQSHYDITFTVER